MTEIVLETSAVAAVFFNEPEREAFLGAIFASREVAISAVSVMECGLVLAGRNGAAAPPLLFAALEQWAAKIVAADAEQATRAIDAYLRYGRGRHPARLNFGDCFAYALAKSLDAPLLFKGEDFAKTDVRVAL